MTQRAKAKKTAGGAPRGEPGARAPRAKEPPRRGKAPAVVAVAAIDTAVEPRIKATPRRSQGTVKAGSAEVSDKRVAALESEVDALRQQLAAARQTIDKLTSRQELVVNRIDWVIDSLHNLLEGED